MVVLAVVNMLLMLLRFPIGLRKPQGSAIADPAGTHRASARLTEPLMKPKKGWVWHDFRMYLRKNWQGFSIIIRTLWHMTSMLRRETRQLPLGIEHPRTSAN
jgi:hypothetical protein